MDSKRIFVQKLTNATAEIVRARKDLYDKYNYKLSPFELNQESKEDAF